MKIPEEIEKYRSVDKSGVLAYFSTTKGDQFGLFYIPVFKGSFKKFCVLVAPTSEDWQHVSVSLPDRCPTWDEMNFIKELFWGEDEIVVQFHPTKSEYVNNHRYCLHLWNHKSIQTPPKELVGVKELGELI